MVMSWPITLMPRSSHQSNNYVKAEVMILTTLNWCIKQTDLETIEETGGGRGGGGRRQAQEEEG